MTLIIEPRPLFLPPEQVRCGGEEFEMHASVVTCGSEYFRAMLEHAMVESGSRSFELHEVRPRVLQRVVEWLYSGELGEISDAVEGLAVLEGSRFLGVEKLEAQCIDWLCAHVEASNCVAVWAEASRLGCGAVVERAICVVGRRLAGVAGEAEFLGLRREALLELVRSDGLSVRSEQVVYEAVMGWVRHDVGSRKAWLGEVLGAVRMALLPTAYLISNVSADPLVMESLEALRIVAEANRDSQLRGAERIAAESDGRLRKRKHAPLGELVVVGGQDTGDSMLKSAEMYDVSTGEWRALPEMSMARSECVAVCIEGNVCVMGGSEMQRDGSYLESAEVYGGSTREWRALPEMGVARYGCAAVYIDGNVFVVGGSDGGSTLKSAEMYDGSTRQWRELPEMSVARYGFAAVCVDGSVYVVGGFGGGSYLNSAEMYDGSMGEWRSLPAMSVARYGCAAVCIEGSVYVVGGSDGMTKHASAECYDPVTNEWRTLPSMSTARWFCAAAVAELGHR